MLTATTNGPYPNRIQIGLGNWIGPLIQSSSPPVEFDPTNPKHLEVYVDGLPLPIQNASYDPVNNRYLLFAGKTFNLQGVVQLIHHMPSPPFQYGIGALPPPTTFTVGIDPLHLPLTLQFYTDTQGSPGWNNFVFPNSEAPILTLASDVITFNGDNTLFMSGYNNPTPPPAGVADPTGVLSLDVSTTTPLVNLQVDSFPNLTSLLFGNLLLLSQVYCFFDSSLASLDTSGLPGLTLLDCDSCNISALDVSHNPLLQTLYCFQQGYPAPPAPPPPFWPLPVLSVLDVTHNPALLDLACFSNNISSLDLSNNPLLQTLNTIQCLLTGLNLSHNPALVFLNCNTNPFAGSPPTLDLSANTALQYLSCSYCNLASLDLSHNPLLAGVECDTTAGQTYALSSLDISNNPVIVHLEIKFGLASAGNHLTSAAVNSILASLVLENTSSPGFLASIAYMETIYGPGYQPNVDLSGGFNDPPTGQGLVDKATLISNGWSVTTN